MLAQELWSRLTTRVRSKIVERQFKTKELSIGRYPRLQGIGFVEVGRGFQVGDGLWLEAVARHADDVFEPRIVIGDRVRVSSWVHIAATHYVEIGDDCLIGSKVLISDHSHGVYSGSQESPSVHASPFEAPVQRRLDSTRSVIIGRNVWLGDGVVVLPDVKIGDGAVIGANSVVCNDIPPCTICVGAPARPIKRYDENAKEWKSIPR